MCMPAVVHISVDEYLSTSYRPDCDYVDGEVQERHLGAVPHSVFQSMIAHSLTARVDQFGSVGMTEQRIQVSQDRFRVPDVCVVLGDKEYGDIIETPPLVCVEVLSPDDWLPDVQQRIDDYVSMRVQNVWVIDPVSHAVWVADGFALTPLNGTSLAVGGTAMTVSLDELFVEFERRLHPRRDRS